LCGISLRVSLEPRSLVHNYIDDAYCGNYRLNESSQVLRRGTDGGRKTFPFTSERRYRFLLPGWLDDAPGILFARSCMHCVVQFQMASQYFRGLINSPRLNFLQVSVKVFEFSKLDFSGKCAVSLRSKLAEALTPSPLGPCSAVL
jgi:hypothetical protein